MDELIKEAAELLRGARRVVVLTGAGVSAESGIPTFRDAMTGLWERYDPTELASPEGFQANPKLVWEWYESRREMVKKCKPNPAHHALAALEKRYEQFALVTQNVDELHTRAGSKNVLELHGRILENRCFEEDRLLTEAEMDRSSIPPLCPCGSYARPGVVWFGEALPQAVLAQSFSAAKKCNVCLVVGTSGVVYPAASIPMLAFQAGATVIEVNSQESELTNIAHLFLQGLAGQLLPLLESKI
jgi:NAD-dependent deacetylase